MSSPVTAIALTTTFTPASSCTHLTMVAPSYAIWYAEVVPIPSETATGCYPSQWLAGYTAEGTSSIAPLATQLVCPLGWGDVSHEGDYMVCCPDGYLLTPPEVVVDSARPGYGGTCYSEFTVGSTVMVTKYDSASLSGTIPWTASTSLMNGYAHPIDGIRYQNNQTSANATSASGASGATSSANTIASNTLNPSPSSSQSSTPSAHLSGGAIAGIVIGCVVALGMLAGILFWTMRRRAQARKAASSAQLDQSLDEQHHEPEKPDLDPTPRYESDMNPVHELASDETPTELYGDNGLHEVEGSSPINRYDDKKYFSSPSTTLSSP